MCQIETYLIINDHCFRDVTNITFAGYGYSYEEAVALTEGHHVFLSDSHQQSQGEHHENISNNNHPGDPD